MKMLFKRFQFTDGQELETPDGYLVAEIYNYSYDDFLKTHEISVLLVEKDDEDDEEFDLDAVIKERVDSYLTELYSQQASQKAADIES